MRNVRISDETVIKASHTYGTPCLCYEESEINYWKQQLLESIPKRAKLIYSVKASHSPVLLQNYIKEDIMFETASDGELSLLLSMEVDPNRIWVSGQGKTTGYIRNAIKHGIKHFHIESINELNMLASFINNSEEYICCLRINPLNTSNKTVLQTAGQSSAFGIDEKYLSDILHSENGNIINGVFLYCGSQFFDEKSILKNTEVAFEMSIKFYDITGKKLKAVDFGGGFGVPECEKDSELDMLELHKDLEKLFNKYEYCECFTDKTNFYFESGRYFSARTACLVTSIMDIKESNGKKFIITDGGINQIGVKQFEYRLHSPYIRHIKFEKTTNKFEEYSIVGTTCTPIDLIHPSANIDNPCIGDLICILDCGGYSLDFSPQHFNGFYTVPEVINCNGNISIYRSRGDYSILDNTNMFVPIGTGNEICDVLKLSCPKDSDEVENIISACGLIKLNHLKCIIYDESYRGTRLVILLKILKSIYNIVPDTIFSNFDKVFEYSIAKYFDTSQFDDYFVNVNISEYFIIIIESENKENITNKFVNGINTLTIKSELIESMEEEFYDCYLHHISELQNAFNLLSDITSKTCFIEYIRTVLENDFWRLPQLSLGSKYWGYDELPYKQLYTHLEDEKWLNIGSCNGDTIFRYFIKGYYAEKIFAVDINKKNLEQCKNNIENIIDKEKYGEISYYNIVLGCGKNEVKIDDFFEKEKITLINMDIEGSEKNVIKSAEKIIYRDRPVLAVCVYHKPEDIYEILLLLKSICKEYSYYLRKYPNYPFHRYNSKEELVLYAIPNERRD